MPLTSFQETPQGATSPELTFRLGAPDVSDAVGVADQAMYELGLAGPDRDQNLEEITNDFTALTRPGYDGRLHVLPGKAVSFGHILAAADAKRPDGANVHYRYPNLWIPGTERNSYTEAELNDGPANHVARLAVFTSLETSYDPVLHDLGKPYDNYRDENLDCNPANEPTQLDGLAADREVFTDSHAGYSLSALNHKAFAFMALMDRIRGVKPEFQILSRGYMRVPDLGRKAVDGGSLVGGVRSRGGRLSLGASDGRADSNVGVGRSMGLAEA